jgi:23S rRNA (adenine2503-C2)-methyltransferase
VLTRIVRVAGEEDLASVFVGRTSDGAAVEFVESVQPPIPRQEKWVLIVSTLKGCPVGCPICDAASTFKGRLSAQDILAQIEHLVSSRFPAGELPVGKLKIQFARMGDPAFNEAVIDVLERLPELYPPDRLFPSISTIAPAGRERFFESLLAVKRARYAGRFQMQFSLHTTDERARVRLVPARTWTFRQMADFGGRFREAGERKITLNFATPRGFPLVPEHLAAVFDPAFFLVKLTPVNPTANAVKSGLTGLLDPNDPGAADRLADGFRRVGYDTIVSIGELKENLIGSNCGMAVATVGELPLLTSCRERLAAERVPALGLQ